MPVLKRENGRSTKKFARISKGSRGRSKRLKKRMKVSKEERTKESIAR